MQLFEKLLKDEEGHIDFLESQLEMATKASRRCHGTRKGPSSSLAELARDNCFAAEVGGPIEDFAFMRPISTTARPSCVETEKSLSIALSAASP